MSRWIVFTVSIKNNLVTRRVQYWLAHLILFVCLLEWILKKSVTKNVNQNENICTKDTDFMYSLTCVLFINYEANLINQKRYSLWFGLYINVGNPATFIVLRIQSQRSEVKTQQTPSLLWKHTLRNKIIHINTMKHLSLLQNTLSLYTIYICILVHITLCDPEQVRTLNNIFVFQSR